MTSTDTTTTAPVSAPTAASSAINTFFSKLEGDFQIFEEDVISVIQNIGAGVLVAANDIQQCFGWLGTHIGQVASTMTAVQNSVTALTAAGVPIPASLSNGITQMTQAAAGVTEALSGQAITANAGSALTTGYNATKALQIAAASAASIAATIQAATAPVPPAPVETAS